MCNTNDFIEGKNTVIVTIKKIWTDWYEILTVLILICNERKQFQCYYSKIYCFAGRIGFWTVSGRWYQRFKDVEIVPWKTYSIRQAPIQGSTFQRHRRSAGLRKVEWWSVYYIHVRIFYQTIDYLRYFRFESLCSSNFLNNFLLPTKVTKTFKPTILSAQEDVIFFAATDAEARQKIHEFNETSCKLGLKPSPKLVFKGENFKSLTGEFEVHFQQIVYRFNSAVRAVDVLIKFSTVFGLEYSKISRLVWNFVSSYMYKIPVPEEYQSIIKLKRYLTVD